MSRRCESVGVVVLLSCAAIACSSSQPKPGTVLDEAMRANRQADSFKAAGEDYFHDMDYPARFSENSPEVQGRNTWIVWTGANDRFWDRITVESVGTFDLLKTISS